MDYLLLILSLMAFLLEVSNSPLGFCEKTSTFDDEFGYGFNVFCTGLQQGHLLQDIEIDKEILVVIKNSVLKNTTSKLFQNVQKTRSLSIVNSTFNFNENEGVFSQLNRLEVLKIENTNFTLTNATLSGLLRLKELYLINNNLTGLETGTFSNQMTLETLTISYNNLVKLSDVPWCDLLNLKSLTLQNNKLSEVDLCSTFCNDTKKVIEFNLNQASVKPQKKPKQTITVKGTLKFLDLSFNQIKYLSCKKQIHKTFKEIVWKNNTISYVENDFNFVKNVKKLLLGNNLITRIDKRIFAQVNQLNYLDLSNNLMFNLSLSGVVNLNYLNLSNNELNSNIFNELKALSFLETLDLNKNQISTINLINSTNILKQLYLFHNNLLLENHSLSSLNQLEMLSLANCNLERIPNNSLINLTKLTWLDLSDNKLSDLSLLNFNSLTSLKHLNLSHNYLKEFSIKSVAKLSSLHTLDISGNLLPNLKYKLILQDMPLLTSLNIKRNPLSCDFLQDILSFFNSKESSRNYSIKNVDDITCELSSNKLIRLEELHVPVVSLTIILICFLLISSIVCYKFRRMRKNRTHPGDEFELIEN